VPDQRREHRLVIVELATALGHGERRHVRARAQERFDASKKAVVEFLSRHGIEPSRTELQGFEVTDVLANPYRGAGEITSRYIITGTLMVRVDDPGLVQKASQGVFQILPRDRAPGVTEESQLNKTVRVVTTVEYALGE